MTNREWHQQMETRRKAEGRERFLLTVLVAVLVIAGIGYMALTIKGAFEDVAHQIETATERR